MPGKSRAPRPRFPAAAAQRLSLPTRVSHLVPSISFAGSDAAQADAGRSFAAYQSGGGCRAFGRRDAPAGRPALHGPRSGAERDPRLGQGCFSETVFVRGERSEVLAQLVEMTVMVHNIER